VSKLEEAVQKRKDLELYEVQTEDGKVSAHVSHHKRGTTATITYDSLAAEAEEAVAAILPRLPPSCTLFVTPRTLSVEEWTARYAPHMETLH
jgi:hypothetical protein